MSDPLFYDEPPRGGGPFSDPNARRRKLIKGAAAGVAVLALIGSIWAFYPGDPETDEPLPVVRADSDPVRRAPSEPGGMDIANRDSTIYETFDESSPGGQAQPPRRVENLIDEEQGTEDQTPVSREELFAGLQNNENGQAQGRSTPQDLTARSNSSNGNSQSQVIDLTEQRQQTAPDQSELQAASETNEDTQTVESAEATTDTESETTASAAAPVEDIDEPTVIAPDEPEEADDNNQVAETAEPETPESTEPAAGPVAAEAGANANYYVQLVSLQDRAKTDQAWSDLQAKHNGLSGMSYRTQSADIEGRGTFYRVQAGPVSKARAEELCAEIKAQSGACLPVAR